MTPKVRRAAAALRGSTFYKVQGTNKIEVTDGGHGPSVGREEAPADVDELDGRIGWLGCVDHEDLLRGFLFGRSGHCGRAPPQCGAARSHATLVTNSVVKVRDRSICLPFMLREKPESTASTVSGPPAGITPSLVNMALPLASAST